jgi:hypothetical protein
MFISGGERGNFPKAATFQIPRMMLRGEIVSRL